MRKGWLQRHMQQRLGVGIACEIDLHANRIFHKQLLN